MAPVGHTGGPLLEEKRIRVVTHVRPAVHAWLARKAQLQDKSLAAYLRDTLMEAQRRELEQGRQRRSSAA